MSLGRAGPGPGPAACRSDRRPRITGTTSPASLHKSRTHGPLLLFAPGAAGPAGPGRTLPGGLAWACAVA